METAVLYEEVKILQDRMDEETYNHCCNVRRAAVRILQQLPEKELLDKKTLENACAILDIGKLLINEYVFHKTERFSQVEREPMNLHSYLGYRIAKEQGVPGMIPEILLYHHGRDQPVLNNVPIMTEKIEQYVNVIHTVDVYEALTEERGYRAPYSPREAYDMMCGKGEYHTKALNFLYDLKL